MSKKVLLVFLSCLLLLGLFSVYAFAEGFDIAMVVKNVGNPFFDAVGRGGQAAADEMGNTLIFQGPPTPTVEGQIEIISHLIAQEVDAIAVSANDFYALVPAMQRARDAGILTISFDSGVHPDGRVLHINQADFEQIGRLQVQAIAEMIDYEGEIAILSAGATMTNQNIWIEWMREELKEPQYENVELVSVVFGDDLRDKSYNEAMGLFKSFPNLRGIISPTTVGIAATGKAISDAGLTGQVQLTGLGLPSEMAEWILAGVCQAMFLWNPVDLGYLTTYVAGLLLDGTISGAVGETLTAGRMGEKSITTTADGGLEVLLGPPFRFDATNIEEWKVVY
ncbi:MAG TPA: rhamnose ABC transporter substrate-binding protein [Atribacteraceae bacterium]|nr:rhamnose ABC transporter substrate-binding protein [Atribacteraceae bacterium]